MVPTRALPVRCPASFFAFVVNSAAAASADLALGSSASPALVSRTPVGLRSNRRRPSASSSALTWPLTAGWLTCNSVAALVR